MSKRRSVMKTQRDIEEVLENLSDLSDIDSDDDAYYITAPLSSPADVLDGRQDQDAVIEKRLEALFGTTDTLQQTIEDLEQY